MSLVSQTRLLRASVYLPPRNPNSPIFTSKPNFHPISPPIKPSILTIKNPKFTPLASVSRSLTVPRKTPQTPTQSPLNDSTRTLKTLLSLAFSGTIIFTKMIQNIALKTISQNPNALSTISPLFFASLKHRPSGHLDTPLTVVVAAGLARWLDIYSGILMIRVLLSWFPNIPWDRQPFPAIRALCDPYLNLFRNIIPPIFNTLDVSPLLAFAILGTLGSILNHNRVMY